MTTHGRISQFHPGKEDWSTWVAQLKYYFTANKVTEDDQKRAILLSNVPPSVFKLVRNIFGDDIETTSFDQDCKVREGTLRAEAVGNCPKIQVQYSFP